MIKTLILAAGEGTRLHPLTVDMPKPMVPINNRPLLEITIDQLCRQGLTELIINLHHRPKAIIDHFGHGATFGVNITYSYEEELLGTAGAIKKVGSLLQDTFVVIYGDVLSNIDYQRLISFHKKKGALVTLSLYRVDNPTQVGLVEIDKDNRVTAFKEKPDADQVFTNLANAGVLICEPGILDAIPEATFFDYGHDLLPLLLVQDQLLYGLPIQEDTYLVDVGTQEKYERAQEEWPRYVD